MQSPKETKLASMLNKANQMTKGIHHAEVRGGCRSQAVFMVQLAGTMPWNVRSKHLTAGLLVVMQCKFHRTLDRGRTAPYKVLWLQF